MGAWSKDSTSHVSTMSDGDFRHSETSVTIEAPTTLTIQHVTAAGTTDLKSSPVLPGEIVAAAVMRKAALPQFLPEQAADPKAQGVLFSEIGRAPCGDRGCQQVESWVGAVTMKK